MEREEDLSLEKAITKEISKMENMMEKVFSMMLTEIKS